MTINLKTGLPFLTGARPSPAHRIFAADWHAVITAPPAQVAYVPRQLSVWGNDRYGDCVTAEEAFAKACYVPEIFISEEEVIRWAMAHGVLNGASLVEVLDGMEERGFHVGPQLYNDGRATVVEFSNQTVLQSAIATGPVKIAIASGALPSDAGNKHGWWDIGDPRNRRTDHCVTLCGYGQAGYLYQQLDVVLPAALPADTFGYLLFTWGTIGFVDYRWVLGTCDEAWVRNPTTIGVPPLPAPPTPEPPVPPTPTPIPPTPDVVEVEIKGHVMPGKYILFPKSDV